MRLLSFKHHGRPSWGAMTGDGIADLGMTLGGWYADLLSALTAGGLTEAESAIAAADPCLTPACGISNSTVPSSPPARTFRQRGEFGPCLVTPEEVGDPHALFIETALNGVVMQSANTSQLIFDIPTLIAYVSSFTELAPGDVIATGTPGGVGFKRDPQVFMKPGDEIVVTIEGVGTLINRVVAEGR